MERKRDLNVRPPPFPQSFVKRTREQARETEKQREADREGEGEIERDGEKKIV